MKTTRIAKETTTTRFLHITEEHTEGTYVVAAHARLTLVLAVSGNKTHDIVLRIQLAGQGAHATIVGLVYGTGLHKTSLHTIQHHKERRTTSDLLVKSVLEDQAHLSYSGEILVEKRAQHTDAYQRNENLLLSDRAHAVSSPALEIYADDVRCTHGATISTVDEAQMNYVRSRGLDIHDAEELITLGFIESGLSRISDTMIAQRAKNHIWHAQK